MPTLGVFLQGKTKIMKAIFEAIAFLFEDILFIPLNMLRELGASNWFAWLHDHKDCWTYGEIQKHENDEIVLHVFSEQTEPISFALDIPYNLTSLTQYHVMFRRVIFLPLTRRRNTS